MEIITKSEEETQKVAKDYAKSLDFGDVIALEGDLGSGKTAFVKGVACALGVREVVTSPTFVISKQYKISNFKNQKIDTGSSLVHIDCYRISKDDAEAVGLTEYLESKENITFIEWPENVKSILPKRIRHIKFEHLGVDKRKITEGPMN